MTASNPEYCEIPVSTMVKQSLDNLKGILNFNTDEEVINFLIQEWIRLGELENETG